MDVVTVPPLGALALNWSAQDSIPRLIVTDSLVHCWANAAALLELARRRDIGLVSDRLITIDPMHQPALSSFAHGCGPDLACFSLPCGDGDGHVLFRGQEIGRIGAVRYIGLNFLRAGRDFRSRYVDLDKIFGLTPGEHRVLQQLLSGRTAEEAASRLDVSVETARTHIRRIYAKLKVNSREGMFSRVSPHRI